MSFLLTFTISSAAVWLEPSSGILFITRSHTLLLIGILSHKHAASSLSHTDDI